MLCKPWLLHSFALQIRHYSFSSSLLFPHHYPSSSSYNHRLLHFRALLFDLLHRLAPSYRAPLTPFHQRSSLRSSHSFHTITSHALFYYSSHLRCCYVSYSPRCNSSTHSWHHRWHYSSMSFSTTCFSLLTSADLLYSLLSDRTHSMPLQTETTTITTDRLVQSWNLCASYPMMTTMDWSMLLDSSKL